MQQGQHSNHPTKQKPLASLSLIVFVGLFGGPGAGPLLLRSGVDLLSSHDCQDRIVWPLVDPTEFPELDAVTERSLLSMLRVDFEVMLR